jgi:tetratricopeptide (TPR) repeat protein
MAEVHRRFNDVKWSDRLDAFGEVSGRLSIVSKQPSDSLRAALQQEKEHESATSPRAPTRAAFAVSIPLNERDDVQSGDSLLREGQLDDALAVYKRRLQICDHIRAKGMPNLQAIEDRDISIKKVTEIALHYLADREYDKARATIDFAISVEPLSQFANLRRAHVLMFSENGEDDARSLYLRYRGQKMTAEQTADNFVLQDFQLLRQAGRTTRLMNEIEELLRMPSDIAHRRLVR